MASRQRGHRVTSVFAVSAALLGLVGSLALTSPAYADDPEDSYVPVTVDLSKTLTTPPSGVAQAGDPISYTISVGCTSTQADCVSLQIADALPAPLVLDKVLLDNSGTNAGLATVAIDQPNNSFVVSFVDPLGVDQNNVPIHGLQAGVTYNFLVTAIVPTGASADWDGSVITNTAHATVANRDSNKDDSADLTLSIPQVLASSATKSFSESELPSVPGRTVALTLGASNTSNTAVDALAVEDATPGAFTYLAVTDASVTEWPADADLVTTDWFDGTDWQLGSPAAAVVLPADPGLVQGLRFTFTSSTGSVIRDASATVVVNEKLRDTVLGITGSAIVDNTATSWVSKAGDVTDPASASDSLTITKKEIAPVATKSFSTNSTVGGVPVTVTLGASNGGVFELNSMSITEPTANSPNLIDQGLTFGAFDQSTIEWPVGATGATIAFQYEGDTDFGAPITASGADSLPVPDPTKGRVAGFRIVFTGSMLQGQYAVVKFSATPGAVAADVSNTNTIAVDVTTTGGLQAQTTADATLITRTARINTSVRKIATPTTLFSVPGSSSIVALPGQLDPVPTVTDLVGGSTVGAKSLTITDADADFFDYFDVSKILPTTVPVGVSLTVEYFDGSTWQQFATNSTATGLTSFSRTLSSAERAAVHGIRFIFTPTSPTAELAPGFGVQPNLRVVLRDTLRSDADTPAANPDAPENVIVANTATSTAVSPATDPSTVTDEATAELTLLPVPSGPGGVNLIDKEWLDETVNARTADDASAVIHWGTANLPFTTVTISDSDTPTMNGAGTAYDAFDLKAVSPITAELDPQLTYDEVTKVQLYISGAWVDTATNPCASNACDGTFPGYVLTPDERRDATGVRLVFAESPTRGDRIDSDPSAPPVGSGVAAAFGLDRGIQLVFTIRDFRRTDPTVPVLGSSRSALYNAGPADYGVVFNSAGFRGVAPDDSTRTDSDADNITILDLPLTVAATKKWDGGPFGEPMPGTPQKLYPTGRLTLTAQNTSEARVDHLVLAEPSANVTVNPFEFFTITNIVSVDVPSGADAPTATVTLLPSGDTFSPAQAEALTADDLKDVTGITVALDGTVLAAGQITLVLDAQLRALSRTDSLPIDPQQVDNEVAATITDAGGSQVPVSGTDNVISDFDQAHADIQVFDYGVKATKTLIADTSANGSIPATQWANTTAATVHLTGQTTGNVRSTTMVFEDTTPSFWNAYNFSGFPALTFAAPINRVQVDVLVGVEYTVGSDNSITSTCPTSNCWVNGTPSTTLALPAGVSASDVRGIRLTFTRDDYGAWERPFNPLQKVDFTVERREYLVTPADQLVPSTLFTFTDKAPGEPVIGTYNNDVSLEANSALSASDTAPLWHAEDTDASAITFAHLPAKISVSKSMYGPQSLGTDLPFDLTIKNTGVSHSSPLTGVTIVDQLPTDGGGPMLVIPTDPDTGLILPASTAFTYSLLNSSGTAVAAPSVTAVYDNATLPTSVTFTLNQTLPLGFSLVIHAPLQFRALLGANLEALNKIDVTADQPFDECRGTVDTQAVAPTNFVFDCKASTTVWPLPSSPMTIVKSVRGIEAGPLDANGDALIDPATNEPYDDLGVLRTTGTTDCSAPNTAIPGRTDLFYRYPCVPITRPGAEEEWGARFYNSGNISIKQLVAMDVLPAANDKGVIIDEARSSKWAAKLSSYPEVTGVPAGTTYTVYYVDAPNIATPVCNGADIQLTMGMTTTTNPPVLDTPQYRNCLDATGAALAVPRDWKVLPVDADAATLASVVAMKFDVRLPTALAPGASIGILYRTLTANQQEIKETNPANLSRDSVSYNSIAGAAVGTNVDTQGNALDIAYRFVTEPRKVGVALATGQVKIAKDVTGSGKSYATDKFNLQLSCTSNGDPVDMTLFTGAARNPFLVTDGTALDVFGVPLYSTCSLTEPGNYGATTVTLPDPVRVLAQHSSSSTVFDPNPAFADRPAVLKATVVNDYPAASLTVTKTINTNGGLDKNGDPIAYKPALASVVCTFNNGVTNATILDVSGQQLVPGTPLVYPNLVAGALCTVTETDQRGATTSYSVTTAAGVVTGTTATPAQFTLTPDSNSVAFANDFGAGSLRVTKVIAGLAAGEAWADGPFTVQVVCTNTNTVVSEVFRKSIVLTRAAPEYLIEHLPTGSSCVTTEPEKNGATTTTLPGTITINRAEQSATVTNTFNYARLNVKKVVTSNAVDGSGTAVKPGPFDFTVLCTFTHGTAATPVTDTVVNSTFQLSHNGTKDFTNLPAGTKCVVTEGTPVGSPTTTIKTTTTAGSATVTALTATINSLTSDSSPTVGTNFALVTNTYPVGSLKIVKSLQGGASTQFGGTQTFQFLVTCTSPGVTAPYSKTVSVVGSASTTVANILAGSTCAVSESNFASTGADARVILNNSNVSFDGTGISIPSGATTQVTFQNWYLTGAVIVTKTVAGPGAAFGTGPFTVHLVCTRGGQNVAIAGGADRQLTNGTSTTYTLLPSGASCVLTETGQGGATSMSIQDANGALDASGAFTFVVGVTKTSLTDNQVQPALSVTNTFQLASLVVSKTVQSAALHEDGSPVTYGSFPMQVTCTFQGSPVRATGFASDTMTFTLVDAASRTLAGLPAGAICTVTETNAHGAARTSVTTVSGGGAPVKNTGATASVTLVTSAVNSAAVLNEYDSGSLALSKVVDGLAREAYGTGTFTLHVECTLVDGASSQVVWSKSYTFTDGSPTETLTPIASGASCVVTETDAAGATSSTLTLNGAVKPAATPVVITANATATATVTNTFDFASLNVTKTVVSDAVDGDGNPVYPGGLFDIEVECKFLGAVVLASEFSESPMAFSIGHEGSQPLTGLPAGASCVITEVNTVGANSTSITTTTANGSASVDSTTATIAYLTSDNAAAATNSAAITNRYGVTSFTVEKVLEGEAAAQFGVGPFDIHVICTAPGGVKAYDETVSLPDAGAWFKVIDNLPNGSVCTTDETNFDDTGADAQTTVDADGNPVTTTTVTADEPGYVAIHNWYLTGSVDVTKLVTGDGGDKFGVGPFTVAIECTRGGDVVTGLPDATQSFVDGETVTFHNLPSGADCTITETNVAGAQSSDLVVDETGAAVTDNTFKVVVKKTVLEDNQAQPALRLENDFPVTSIVISKNVLSDAVDETDAAVPYGPFSVTVTCTFEGVTVYGDDYDADNVMAKDIVEGTSWTITGLPVDAECAIEETNAMGAAETSITTTVGGDENSTNGTTATITLAPDDANLVDIDNTFNTGSIELNKLVSGDGKTAWGTEAFEITLECTLTDATGTRNAYTNTFTFHQGDDSIWVHNIAAGSHCVVTETQTGFATATSVTVGANDPIDGTSAEFDLTTGNTWVQVENRFDVTSVTVDKVRSGDGADLWGAGPFEATLVCERGDDLITIPGGATRPLAAPDYTAEYDGLPVDATCVIAETKFGGANGSVTSPASFTLGADATPVTITNDFREGVLEVDKTIKGDGVGIEEWGVGPFEVTAECTRVVNGETVTVEIPDGATRPLASPDYAATFEHLPEGATCEITETEDGDATSTTIDPGTVTIAGNETTVVDVTNTFTIGQLHIVKTASQPVVQADDSFDYTFDVSNTGTVPAAGVTVVDEIPALLKVTDVSSDGWTDCAVADTDTFGYGGTLTCVYDKTLKAGESATAITVTVSVHPDIQVDDIVNVASVTSTTRGVKGDDDDEKVLVKWLAVGAAGECQADAPWLNYEINAHNLDTTGKTLTVTWRDGSGTVVKTEEIPLDGGPISGKLLWPGAAVNADGVGIMWPGWRAALPGETPEFENLVLDPTLPEYGLRDDTEVTFSINPSTTVSVLYPPARADCANVVRDPGLWVKKVASTVMVGAGDTFDYTITSGNDGLGSVSDVVLTDPIPASLKVLTVTPADAASPDVPAWQSCAVTDRLANGYGGTVTCVLDRPLGYLDPVPAVVLHVQLDPRAAQGSIVNVAKLTGKSTMGQVTLSAQDQAVVMTPGMLAMTGMVVGGFVLPLALGFLTLGGILIAVRVTRRRRELGTD